MAPTHNLPEQLKSHDPAFPVMVPCSQIHIDDVVGMPGISRRLYIAAEALKAIISSCGVRDRWHDMHDYAMQALKYADILVEADKNEYEQLADRVRCAENVLNDLLSNSTRKTDKCPACDGNRDEVYPLSKYTGHMFDCWAMKADGWRLSEPTRKSDF